MSLEKVYTIFAGVNGAGKSTFYKLLNLDFGIRINADEIVKDQFNNDWENKNTQTAAARIAVKMRKDCIDGGASFNQETTLAGNTIISVIKKAKDKGFKINLYYVGLESMELSIERVAARRRSGGHGVPEEDLIRRYTNSFENLKLVLPLCDNIQIHDNSGNGAFDIMNPLLLVKDGKGEIWDKNCPKYFKDVLQDYVTGLNKVAKEADTP
ncbi:MAG: zeta toxin family protein [Oscillospiraceae bacterium]|jgi:predicted ABC-type ATPase|nr:zeta toxin family protein [Oscillospiraceae bacterium]